MLPSKATSHIYPSPFPQGEDVADFKKRSVKGWYDMIKQCRLLNYSDIACVIHGGTIMSVMSEIYGGGYYDYHCGNDTISTRRRCCGF